MTENISSTHVYMGVDEEACSAIVYSQSSLFWNLE